MRTGAIIIAKGIKLNKDYKNVLSYTNSEMESLIRSDAHFVGQSFNYSFIRNTGRIRTDFTYAQTIAANYMMFNNPDYRDKWFFAFIDRILYISDKCIEIEYTIDVHTTWWGYWNVGECYVEREHISNDYVGASYTPEPFSVDNYVARQVHEVNVKPDRICFLFSEARKSEGEYVSPYEAYSSIGGIPFNDGLPMTLWRVRANLDSAGVNELCRYYGDYIKDGKGEDLVGIFTYSSSNEIGVGVDAGKITSIGGYTPRNAKVLQYPFIKLTLSNQSGGVVELRQEDFSGDIVFMSGGTDNYKGQSICYPASYKGVERNTDCGLLIDNYPTIPMTIDSFATYLAQNSISMSLGAMSSVVGAVSSIVTGNPLGAVAGIGSGINQMGQLATAKTVPDSVVGMANGNLIATKLDNFKFLVEFNTCYEDVARMADDYFTKFGYNVSAIKVPNLTGRSYNYVKISSDSCIGYGEVPAQDMEIINNSYRSGLTVWASHDNIGNYK